jgi:quercetin dioxygenase-like cupin family protein
MTEFAMLDCNNQIVFEDDEIAVAGLVGDVVYRASTGTTFVTVAEGKVVVTQDDQVVCATLSRGMYGCVPQPRTLKTTRCVALVVSVKNYDGMFSIGGPLEDKGRLKYIDGCTDSGLIHPPKKGDPCLNGLFFPPGIVQTSHYHPSHRIGLVYDGRGLCHSGKTVAMSAGGIFMIPKGVWHGFETAGVGMRIVAFHPDSDFGPTDESHQMLDATLTDGNGI